MSLSLINDSKLDLPDEFKSTFNGLRNIQQEASSYTNKTPKQRFVVKSCHRRRLEAELGTSLSQLKSTICSPTVQHFIGLESLRALS